MKKEVKAQLDNRENKSHIRSTEVIQVIKTVSFLGKGTDENPNRFIDQYWTLEGELLATVDPLMDSDADNLHFMKKLKKWSEPISEWISRSDNPNSLVVINSESFQIEEPLHKENECLEEMTIEFKIDDFNKTLREAITCAFGILDDSKENTTTENSDDLKQCNICGVRAERINAKFCFHCGTKFD